MERVRTLSRWELNGAAERSHTDTPNNAIKYHRVRRTGNKHNIRPVSLSLLSPKFTNNNQWKRSSAIHMTSAQREKSDVYHSNSPNIKIPTAQPRPHRHHRCPQQKRICSKEKIADDEISPSFLVCVVEHNTECCRYDTIRVRLVYHQKFISISTSMQGNRN